MNERGVQRVSEQAVAEGLALVVLMFCPCGFGGTVQPQKTLVSGRVVDYLARPVEGAEVAIYERARDFSTGRDVARLRDEIRRTDAEGRFVIASGITPRYSVFVVARKENYALAWDLLSQTEENVLVLEKPSVLAGVVVDAEGKPVTGAKVRAVPKSTYLRRLEQEPILAPEPWFTTRTDDRGTFRFDSFSADVNTDFWVEAPGWALTYQYSTHRLTAWGFEARRTDIRLVLPREVELRGRVVEAQTGAPVPGTHVLLHPQDIAPGAHPFLPEGTISGADGEFVFRGVAPGGRYVDVSAPEQTQLVDRRVTLDIGPAGPGEKMVVRLARGGLIEIAAREGQTGQPIQRLRVYLWESVQNGRSSFYKDAVTDTNGILRVPAPVGACQFSVRLDGYSPSSYQGGVTVAAGQTAKAEMVVDRLPNVLKVVLDEGGQPVCGAIVNNALAHTDAAGRFEVPLAPDDLDAWIVRHMQRNLAAVVPIERDQSGPISLKPALTVAGQITDPEARGIPAARVALHVRVSGVLVPYGHEFLTDSQGRYEVTAVAPEQSGFEYRISVNASGYGTRQFRRISIRGEPGTRVNLDPIVLAPAQESISGVVLDAQGQPAGGVPILTHGDNQPSRITVTDGQGRFVIRRVCRGLVKIQAGLSNLRAETGSVYADGGAQEVQIVLGQEGTSSKDTTLKGRLLPDTKNLGLDLAQGDIADRRILICFFDVQQRPSRNAVLELAKQIESLRQKGIALAAVQAAKVDRAELDRWISNSKISWPVGMIEADAEKAWSTWGVKSLPWLILTDRARVVVAEGFSPAELEQEIRNDTK